jgi:uncharacterized protein YegP (UPF0339 family)
MLNQDDSVSLRSQGYKSESGRDNGIQSVKKNRDLDERWESIQEKGKHIGVLKAGNKQEIARTCPQGSKPSKWWGLAAAAPAVAAAVSGNQDEYLHCDKYKGHKRLTGGDSDFSTFEQDGRHYFAMLNKDNSVALRSQAYKSTGGRDNGIQSVKKNRDLKDRWESIQEKGKHIGVLRAGNKQEIARTCPQGSKPAAWWGLAAAPAVAAVAAVAPKPKKVEKKVVAAAPVKKKEEKKVAAAAPVAAAAGGSGCLKYLWWLIPLLLLLGLLWFLLKGCDKGAAAVVDEVKTEKVVEKTAAELAAEAKAKADEAARVAAEAEERRLAAEKLKEETRAKKKKATYTGGNKNSGF